MVSSSAPARARRGQFAPSRYYLGSRIAQLCFIHHPPDVLNEARDDGFARGERRQRRVELSQGGAMFVLPGNEQRLAIFFQSERSAAFARDGAEAVGGVDVPDPSNGRKLKAGLAGAPFEWPGPITA